MSVGQDDEHREEPGAPPRAFSAADARQKAEQARQKAEFILSRAYGLMRDPKAEWEQIRKEETNVPSILLGYVAPLAGLFAICGLIGSYAFVIVRPDIDKALIGAVVTFIAMTALVYLMGFIINAIAENFDSDRDDLAAQKVAAYSMTPFFLSGLFWLWPPLTWLTFVAIGLSAFLLYRALPPLMKTPPERALGFAATVWIAELVAFIIIFALAGCVTGANRL